MFSITVHIRFSELFLTKNTLDLFKTLQFAGHSFKPWLHFGIRNRLVLLTHILQLDGFLEFFCQIVLTMLEPDSKGWSFLWRGRGKWGCLN